MRNTERNTDTYMAARLQINTTHNVNDYYTSFIKSQTR